MADEKNKIIDKSRTNILNSLLNAINPITAFNIVTGQQKKYEPEYTPKQMENIGNKIMERIAEERNLNTLKNSSDEQIFQKFLNAYPNININKNKPWTNLQIQMTKDMLPWVISNLDKKKIFPDYEVKDYGDTKWAADAEGKFNSFYSKSNNPFNSTAKGYLDSLIINDKKISKGNDPTHEFIHNLFGMTEPYQSIKDYEYIRNKNYKVYPKMSKEGRNYPKDEIMVDVASAAFNNPTTKNNILNLLYDKDSADINYSQRYYDSPLLREAYSRWRKQINRDSYNNKKNN